MITFREVQEQDMSLINKWQSSKHVYNFFNSGDLISGDAKFEDFKNTDKEESVVLIFEDRAVGLLQIGRVAAHIANIVYFIGEPEMRGKGLAKLFIAKAIEYIEIKGYTQINASLVEINLPSWKTLISCGFLFCGRLANYDKVIIQNNTQYFHGLNMIWGVQDELTQDIHKLILTDLINREEELLAAYNLAMKE